MPGQITRTKRLSAALAALSLLSAAPAAAQDTDTLDRQATEAFNAGVDASREGRFSVACIEYGNAAVLFHNTIMSLIGQPMGTEEDRDNIKTYADNVQVHLNQAKEEAKYACSRGDGPVASSEQSGSSSGTSASTWTADDYRASEYAAIQDPANRAAAAYKEADRLYDAKDFAGACASARNSAAIFTYVVTQLRTYPELRGAFDNPDQILANAATAAKDRDGYFCKA